MKYNPALDGLRAYAVGLVILAHLPPVTGVEWTFRIADIFSGMRLGYLGVDIFFVLSGYLVTSILVTDKQKGRFSFLRFYAKRTLRIFPIFYLSLLVCAIFFAMEAEEIIANALYVSNYYYVFFQESSPLRHTWSLAVEEQFYLIWPLVVFLVPSKYLGRVLLYFVPLVVVVSMVAVYYSIEPENFHRLVTRGTMFRIFSLGGGALLAIFGNKVVRMPLTWVSLLILVAVIGHGVSLFLPSPSRAILGFFSMSSLSIGIFWFVLIDYDRRLGLLKTFLERPSIVYIGKISYGIYLYHYIVLHALNGRVTYYPEGVTWTVLAIFLSLSLIIPMLSYRFIESPLLRIKESLNPR